LYFLFNVAFLLCFFVVVKRISDSESTYHASVVAAAEKSEASEAAANAAKAEVETNGAGGAGGSEEVDKGLSAAEKAAAKKEKSEARKAAKLETNAIAQSEILAYVGEHLALPPKSKPLGKAFGRQQEVIYFCYFCFTHPFTFYYSYPFIIPIINNRSSKPR
jgi:hypothetical protein